MSTQQPGEHLQLERFVFFSDAVFAIAITLLVLEIRLPELGPGASDGEIGHALLHVLPKIVGFIVSFLVIGAYWEGHHRIFAVVARVDRGLVWRNLFLLLTVSFMPFPTAVFSEYPSGGLPLRFYCVSLAAVGLCSNLVARHATRDERLLVAGDHTVEIRRMRYRTLATPIVCGLAAMASFGSLRLARVLLLAIPLAVGIGDWLARRSSSR